MALELLNRPQGYKLTDSSVTGTAYDDGTGIVQIVTDFAHGLIDGDHVLIESNISSYNGFVEVDSVAYNTFKIKSGGDYIEFIQSVEINYYVAVLAHGWQCVHLPIVYELESDIFPNNTAEESYQPNTVVSFSNSNGYVQLNLSQALSDPTELAKIELVGEGTLAGVYQILTVVQPWAVVIDLVYSASYSFTGYVIVKYYDNYAINVEIYAGLEAGHRWETVKPFELAATLKFIPDAEGRAKFSINEVLRGYIQTRNKLDLDTLPNNLDFMVEFYIRYFESYDESDGDEITTHEGDQTTDDFIGKAVNAKLPFKNIYSGHLSEYINEDTYLAKWLTLFVRPLAVVGRFFDLSFLLQYSGVDIVVTIYKSLEGVVTDTEVLNFENPGMGVMRIPIEAESGFDEYCIQVSTEGTPEIPGVTTPIVLPDLDEGVNIAGSGINWTTGSAPTVTLTGTGSKSSDIWCNLYNFIEGYTYELTPDISYVVEHPAPTITFIILDSGNNIIYQEAFPAPIAGSPFDTPISFMASDGYAKYGFKVSRLNIVGSTTDEFTINSITGTQTTPTIPEVLAQTITEQLCIGIIEECDSTNIPDDIRLTEDGNFRILE